MLLFQSMAMKISRFVNKPVLTQMNTWIIQELAISVILYVLHVLDLAAPTALLALPLQKLTLIQLVKITVDAQLLSTGL
jgi:hypothetical protein